MFQIQSTEQVTDQQGVKVLVYGKAKVGKTTLARTAPNPLIISAERGLLSLRGAQLPVIQINNIIELTNVHAWLLRDQQSTQFHTICVDSISDIAEVCLTEEKAKSKKDPRQAYGELAEHMVKIIRNFRDLPRRHVYMIAKEEYDKDGDMGMMMFRPSMPGKQLTKDIPYMFDEILQLFIHKDDQGALHRVLRCHPDNQNIAGDRSGKLGAYEPADLGHIITKILA